MSNLDVVHLKPQYYTHVEDANTSATVLKVGPLTFTKREHERVVIPKPEPFIVIPPNHYCIIENPVVLGADGKPKLDGYGQAEVQIGDMEIRRDCEPFPLYPGEKLQDRIHKLEYLEPNTGVRVKALGDFEDEVDGKKVMRKAGDEWHETGPKLYYPHVSKEIVRKVTASFVHENQALQLRALNDFVDRTGTERKAGTQWLWTKFGAYIPSVDEEVAAEVTAKILTEQRAIHVRCTNAFKDVFGVDRKPGDTWLVTHKQATSYLPSPNEQVVSEVPLQVISKRQFCVVLDPFDAAKGENRLGSKKLLRGPETFFLHPGEHLQGGRAEDVYVLMPDEALLLEAIEAHTDEMTGDEREAGDRWMISGPCEYVPPVSVELIEKRQAIAMHAFEGVYIRDLKTGKVRAQTGPKSYMLTETEELWEKELPAEVEALLTRARGDIGKPQEAAARDKTRVVFYSVPHNSLCQIFDYKKKTARCVPGPDMVALDPNEEFTVISLSGGKPKRPGVIKSLALCLGPDFMTDNIRVETADHARLELQLSYNWSFEVDPTRPEDRERVFGVADFVGDSCKAIASRIRGCCAGETFDNFHKNSSAIIRHAVFGSHPALLSQGRVLSVGTEVVVASSGKVSTVADVSETEAKVTLADGTVVSDASEIRVKSGGEEFSVELGKWPNSALKFPTNGLVVSNVDIQSVEPVDQKTKNSLLKSVQLAIHITTQGQEAQAKHHATEEEQRAKGELESQLIRDKAAAERERKKLLELKAESQAIEASGSQRAEATAAAEAAEVDSKCMVELARVRAEAQKIQVEVELELEQQKNEEIIEHKRSVDALEVEKAKSLGTIEAQKFGKVVESIGKKTIEAIAKAGPENQVRLLKALNLQGYMVTDGSSPINLFNAAQGMTGQIAQ